MAPYFHATRFVFGSTPTSSNCVDVPLAGDFIADGVGQLAMFRRLAVPEFAWQRPDGATVIRTFGAATDEPVLGDWDGNGTTNLGVRKPATATRSHRPRHLDPGHGQVQPAQASSATSTQKSVSTVRFGDPR